MERIKSAAVRIFTPDNEEIIVTGSSHDAAVHSAWEIRPEIHHHLAVQLLDPSVEGYVTTTGRFVNRQEAYEIAEAAGQLKYPNSKSGWLDSYNCNFAKE